MSALTPGQAASRSGEISREYKKRLHETENDEIAKNSVKIFATEKNCIGKGLSCLSVSPRLDIKDVICLNVMMIAQNNSVDSLRFASSKVRQ